MVIDKKLVKRGKNPKFGIHLSDAKVRISTFDCNFFAQFCQQFSGEKMIGFLVSNFILLI